jgi:hypothetical protein
VQVPSGFREWWKKVPRDPLEDRGSVLPRSESESDVCVAEVELDNLDVIVSEGRLPRK